MSLQSADFIACSGTWSLPFEYNPLHSPASNLIWAFTQLLTTIFNFNPVCFSGGQHEAPATLEVGVARDVPVLWSGGWWPSHPSPLQAHTEEPGHTFSIYQPYHELFLLTSCASNMSRGEEERSHGAGLRSPATNGHHICGGSPTARRMDGSDSANCLPQQRAW